MIVKGNAMLPVHRLRRRRLAIRLIAATAVLAAALYGPGTAGAQPATFADITARDQLIYD